MVLPLVKCAGNPQQGNVAKLALPIRNNPGALMLQMGSVGLVSPSKLEGAAG